MKIKAKTKKKISGPIFTVDASLQRSLLQQQNWKSLFWYLTRSQSFETQISLEATPRVVKPFSPWIFPETFFKRKTFFFSIRFDSTHQTPTIWSRDNGNARIIRIKIIVTSISVTRITFLSSVDQCRNSFSKKKKDEKIRFSFQNRFLYRWKTKQIR